MILGKKNPNGKSGLQCLLNTTFDFECPHGDFWALFVTLSISAANFVVIWNIYDAECKYGKKVMMMIVIVPS